MVDMIGQLVDIGRAYVTDDGVYLSVESVEDYGLLAHQSLDDLLAGGGEREVYGAGNKRHPGDFVLWKLPSPTSRRGRRRGAKADRAGTASAW